jgi:hypothetical protein
MPKLNLKFVSVLFTIFISSLACTSCKLKEKPLSQDDKTVNSLRKQSGQNKDSLIPYVDLKPLMPIIPTNITQIAKKTEVGERGYGQTLSEREVRYCGLTQETAFIIFWSFRNYSANPVIIQNKDGTRQIAPKKCTHLITYGRSSMNIGILSIPITQMNNQLPLSKFYVNPNLRKIMITAENGGQWNEIQKRNLHSLFVDLKTGKDR